MLMVKFIGTETRNLPMVMCFFFSQKVFSTYENPNVEMITHITKNVMLGRTQFCKR